MLKIVAMPLCRHRPQEDALVRAHQALEGYRARSEWYDTPAQNASPAGEYKACTLTNNEISSTLPAGSCMKARRTHHD